METEHKTWIPMIAIGLIVGFMLGYVAQQAVPTSSTNAADNVVDATVQVDPLAYKQEVQRVIASYQANGNVEIARDALLDLRVPAEFTSDHLSFVLALGSHDGSIEADERLNVLISSLNWF